MAIKFRARFSLPNLHGGGLVFEPFTCITLKYTNYSCWLPGITTITISVLIFNGIIAAKAGATTKAVVVVAVVVVVVVVVVVIVLVVVTVVI